MPAPSLSHEVSKRKEMNKQPPGAWGQQTSFKMLVGCFFPVWWWDKPLTIPLALGSCPSWHSATPGPWAHVDGAPQEGLHAEIHITTDGFRGHPGMGQCGQ